MSLKDILDSRIDICQSAKEIFLKDEANLCLAERHIIINEIEYHLVCGEDKNHNGDHEDIQGGIWWK